MCDFWQAGAETVENLTFGERSLEKQNKVEHNARFCGTMEFQGVLRHYWCDMCYFCGKSEGGRLT